MAAAEPLADPPRDRLDWWRNIPVPTSYMAMGTRDDFFGGYDHSRDAGFVHWADHRIAPGNKQWSWGNSEFGRAWEANLSDFQGPYIELMAGVFTDNQPDFAYLLPGETKRSASTGTRSIESALLRRRACKRQDDSTRSPGGARYSSGSAHRWPLQTSP